MLALFGSLWLLAGCGGNADPPPPKPNVTMSAFSTVVTLGQSVMLTWSSTNATSCTASASPSESDWSGSKPTNGSQSVTPASSGNNAYTLMCIGAGGNASNSVLVTGNGGQGGLTNTSGTPPGLTNVGSVFDLRVFCIYGNSQICKQSEIRDGFPLTASGGVERYVWTWAAAPGSSLPPGLSIATRTYHKWSSWAYNHISSFDVIAIAGIPTKAGDFNVVVTVTDSARRPAHVSTAYTIHVNKSLFITSGLLPVGVLNVPYSFTFQPSGAGLTWTETGVLPPGLTFSEGILSGTPTSTGSFP